MTASKRAKKTKGVIAEERTIDRKAFARFVASRRRLAEATAEHEASLKAILEKVTRGKRNEWISHLNAIADAIGPSILEALNVEPSVEMQGRKAKKPAKKTPSAKRKPKRPVAPRKASTRTRKRPEKALSEKPAESCTEPGCMRPYKHKGQHYRRGARAKKASKPKEIEKPLGSLATERLCTKNAGCIRGFGHEGRCYRKEAVQTIIAKGSSSKKKPSGKNIPVEVDTRSWQPCPEPKCFHRDGKGHEGEHQPTYMEPEEPCSIRSCGREKGHKNNHYPKSMILAR